MTTVTYPNPEDLRVYAILNLQEPPRLLISKCGGKKFQCYFGLPLPQQIIIFRLGKCTSFGYRSRIAIEVCLDSRTLPFLIGYLDNYARSACYQPRWPGDFLTRSYSLHEKDKMARLRLTIVDGTQKSCLDDSFRITPEKLLQQIETKKLVVSVLDEPALLKKFGSTSQRPAKRTKKINNKTSQKRKKTSVDGNNNNNNNHLVKASSLAALVKPCDKCLIELTPVPSPHSEIQSILEQAFLPEVKDRITWPSNRWGHTASVISGNQVVIIGGQGEHYQMVKDSLCIFDCETNMWKTEIMQPVTNRRMGHSSTYDPMRNVIYVYGGCKKKQWVKDVNVLDLHTWEWTNIKAVGLAPERAYHSSLLFQGELVVLGGVYPNSYHKPGSCSNTLYTFNPETSTWCEPTVTGQQPPPCSGHSFELYEADKAIIFGGWDVSHCYNDVFLLDVGSMEYKKPDVLGVKPVCRTWHSSTILTKHCFLIHGGFDGAANKVLEDSFIFDIDKLTWVKVDTSPKIQPCAGHIMFKCHTTDNDEEEKIMVFGGGDNRGKFFNDLTTIDTLLKL